LSGLFLSFEGIEGSGKSTQCAALAAELRRRGRDVVETREPGGLGVEASEAIRALLLDPKMRLHARAELLLFQASRAQHVEQLIRPALQRGAVVLCDRFCHASLAYQGGGRGVDLDQVRWLNRFATSGLRPDLTILLDLEAAEGISRIRARSGDSIDRIESEAIEFHQRVRDGYLREARSPETRFLVLDATLPRAQLGARILAAIEALGTGSRRKT